MSKDKDKYNDYDQEENVSEDVGQSRRRRAAKMREDAKKAGYTGMMSAASQDNGGAANNASEADSGEDEDNNTKKRSPMKIFFTVLLSILGVYVIVMGIFAMSTYLNDDPEDDWNVVQGDTQKPMDKIQEVFSPKLPERTQFVLMCTDEDGTRTDTIMVGCYNSVTQGISLISVPRDTVVSVSAANYQTMREEFPEPGRRTMKINAVHHYAGEKLGPEMLVDELNSLLGTDIQYYVRVNFDAFHYLIDSIGGIEFDVPQKMDYDDPTQDLSIHLSPGLQMLDGDKAEQLVRWRQNNDGTGYFNGDIGRIAMQQNFMKVLVQKLADVDTIKSNPKAYVTAFIKYITTNAGISDAVKYASALNKIDPSKLETYLLPGDVRSIGGISGGYAPDSEGIEQLVYDIFEKPVSEMISESTSENASGAAASASDSKSASIQVLNGGYTNGKAGEVEAALEADGYTVDEIGTYNEEKKENTRIYVNKNGLGEDLKDYFKDAEIIVDEDLTADFDIVIVIGTEE